MEIWSFATCFWLIVALFFLLLEMGSPGLFFFISFFCGGLVAAISALFVSSVIAQTILFFVATIGALVPLRYFVVPYIEKNRPHERTNVYAMIGKRGFVITKIEKRSLGLVKINGITWAARSISEAVEVGDEVEVVDLRGAHVIVKKV